MKRKKWTEKTALLEAKKYNGSAELQRNCRGAYKFLYRNGLIKKAYPMSIRQRQSHAKKQMVDNFENCRLEALKYDTRSEFSEGSRYHYRSACKNGWMDEICSHMKTRQPYWTYERCKAAAKQCKSKKEFRDKFKIACEKSSKNGWMEDFGLEDGRSLRQRETYIQVWYYENSKQEAEKYRNRAEFQKGCSGAYKASKKEGWIDEFFPMENYSVTMTPIIKRLHSNISSRIRKCLNFKRSSFGKWSEILEYSWKELYNHLESQFTDGMSWDNYGEWHIDHIIPVSWFDIEDINDPKLVECWGLDNLQPMWAHENASKGNRYAGKYDEEK